MIKIHELLSVKIRYGIKSPILDIIGFRSTRKKNSLIARICNLFETIENGSTDIIEEVLKK